MADSSGGGQRQWAPAVVAGCLALASAALGISTNVASTLIPNEWAEEHAAWVWSATGGFALVAVVLAVMAARSGGDGVGSGTSIEIEDSPGGQGIGSVTGGVVTGPGGTAIGVQHVHPPAPQRRIGPLVIGAIPGRSASFVDRDQVRAVEDALAEHALVSVCALTGGRGVGKTQVAAEVARRAAARGWPVVAWASAETRDGLLADLSTIAGELGVADPEGDSLTSARRLRTALQSRYERALLVLDNATAAAAIDEFIPTAGATRTIVTSTDRAFAARGVLIDVGVYDRPQSLAYLRDRTRRDDPLGAAMVAEEVGDSPLGLSQAAAVLLARPGLTYLEFAERLRDQPLARQLPAERGGDYPRGVAEAILQSVEVATDSDPSGLRASILGLLSVLASEGSATTLIAQLAEPATPDDVETVLADLVGGSLLIWADDGSGVVMHRLVARAFRDQAEASGQLVGRLSSTALTLNAVLPPEERAWDHREDGQALVSHATQLWTLVAALHDRHPMPSQDIEPVSAVATWALRHLIATADLARAIISGTQTLTDSVRVLGTDHPDTLTSRNNLAYTYKSAGDLTRAIPLHEQTLTDSVRVLGTDHPNTLTSRNNLAYAYESAGDLTRAILLYEQTLTDMVRVLGTDHPDTLTSRNNLAGAYQSAGDLTRATALYEQTLTDRVRVLGPDHPDTLNSRNNLAGAYESAGDLTRAIPVYEQTLTDRVRVLGTDHPDTRATRDALDRARRGLSGE